MALLDRIRNYFNELGTINYQAPKIAPPRPLPQVESYLSRANSFAYNLYPEVSKGTLETLAEMESSQGKNTTNKPHDFGEFGYLTGLTKTGHFKQLLDNVKKDPALKEKYRILQQNVPGLEDLSTPEAAMAATASVWYSLKLNNPNLSDEEIYFKLYNANPEVDRPDRREKFKETFQSFAPPVTAPASNEFNKEQFGSKLSQYFQPTSEVRKRDVAREFFNPETFAKTLKDIFIPTRGFTEEQLKEAKPSLAERLKGVPRVAAEIATLGELIPSDQTEVLKTKLGQTLANVGDKISDFAKPKTPEEAAAMRAIDVLSIFPIGSLKIPATAATTIAKSRKGADIAKILLQEIKGLSDETANALGKVLENIGDVDEVQRVLNRTDFAINQARQAPEVRQALLEASGQSEDVVKKALQTRAQQLADSGFKAPVMDTLPPATSKGLEPLAQEISKAKASGQSFDEWVKGQAIKTKLETNGVKVNPDNTVTLYHATLPERAVQIEKSGVLKPGGTATGGMTGLDLQPSAFLGTDKKWVADTWGQGGGKVIEIKVPVQDIRQPSQNFKEVYFEGGLKRGSDGIWRPVQTPRSTFYDRLAERDFVKTRSQLKAEWDGVGKEVEAPKVKPTPEPAQAPTIASIRELGRQVDELAGKSKEEIRNQIDELAEQVDFMKERLDEMTGGKLQRFVSRKEGQFLDLENPERAKTPAQRQRIIERNERVLRASESAFETTVLKDRYDDPDIIREAIEEHRDFKEKVAGFRNTLTGLRGESAVISRGQEAARVGRRQRRAQFQAVQDRYTLTDYETSRFLRGRNISVMDESEWQNFLREAEKFGEETEKHREAMIQLKGTIHDKELKKWENLRAALNLPPVNQMSIEQLKNLEKILAQYKTGDEFLTVRMLQTIDNTELAGVKTTREVLEILAQKSGKTLEEMPIKVTQFHRMLGDRRLARQHPFLELLVERKNRSLIESEARIIELSDELDDLVKKARASRQRSVLERLVPTDENITRWSETLDEATKAALEKQMTKEEIAVVRRWDEIRRAYYDYLVKRHAGEKFSRFEGQYFPHVRRGFLEAWKEDDILSAFKEMRDKYRQDAFTMDILNEQTGEILPYEKWIGFAQFRSEKLIPTSNAARAFESYITALEKAKHLDEMVPEMMVYVHTLSPRNFSQYGVELDTSLKKFVKEYINANKGRVPKGFFNPGESFDVSNRSLITLTRMLDLGFNFSTQVAAPVGENLMTLTMLKPAAYKTAQLRFATKEGRAVVNKYKNFTGRTVWDELTRASSGLGDKLLAGAFSIYGTSTRQANGLFLLGKMTEEEFGAGVISSQRLAQLKIEMSKYRAVPGLESILGRTTEAEAAKQYKSWAIPPLTATIENARELANLVRKEGVGKALSSDQGKELFYSIGMGTALGLLFYTKYRDLKDKGGERSFMEDVAFKAMRDAVSIYGVFDPTLWTGVRVSDFLGDLSQAALNLIILEEYKTTGKLKGPTEFRRTLTPAILKRFDVFEKKESDLPDFPALPTLPTLPELPSLPQ
jgi:hypothetical protein